MDTPNIRKMRELEERTEKAETLEELSATLEEMLSIEFTEEELNYIEKEAN